MTDSASREPGANAPASDSLRLSLQVPDEVQAGEPVPITLRAENVADRPLELHLRGREIAFDLIVAGSGGSVVWRRLEGEIVPAILRLETLAAGDALILESTWGQRTDGGGRVEPGVYTVHGELLTDDEPLVTPAEMLRIVDGH